MEGEIKNKKIEKRRPTTVATGPGGGPGDKTQNNLDINRTHVVCCLPNNDSYRGNSFSLGAKS